MCSSFRVDTGSLEQVIVDLERITNALTDALEQADTAVNRMHQQWDGDAADAHLASHEEWSGDAQRMREALGRMRSALGVAQSNYVAAVAANTRMWS